MIGSNFLESNLTIIVVSSLCWLAIISYWSFHAGRKAKFNAKLIAADTISSQMLAVLALIMGFAFSLTISRFESRRELAIREANAIQTAYLHSELIHFKDPLKIKRIFQEYVDIKMEEYNSNMSSKHVARLIQLETELWNTFKEVAKSDRGALESTYALALHDLFDSASSRSFALIKMLPPAFYLLILIILSIGLASLNYDRGYQGDAFHWRASALIFIFGILLLFIYDLDHSKGGLISISQDAFVELRKRM